MIVRAASIKGAASSVVSSTPLSPQPGGSAGRVAGTPGGAVRLGPPVSPARARGEPANVNVKVLKLVADPVFPTELGQFNIGINVPPRGIAAAGLSEFE